MEYNEFVKKANNNEILIGIEPSVARKFFSDLDKFTSINLTNKSLSFERFLVKFFLIAEFLFAFSTCVISILSIKWYSFLYIPLFLIIWMFYRGKASLANQNISGVILFTLLMFLASFILFKDKWILFCLCINTSLPFLFARLLYKFSTIFLRNNVINHQKLYDMLLNKGVFIKNV
jgi:hypothetical protein